MPKNEGCWTHVLLPKVAILVAVASSSCRHGQEKDEGLEERDEFHTRIALRCRMLEMLGCCRFDFYDFEASDCNLTRPHYSVQCAILSKSSILLTCWADKGGEKGENERSRFLLTP